MCVILLGHSLEPQHKVCIDSLFNLDCRSISLSSKNHILSPLKWKMSEADWTMLTMNWTFLFSKRCFKLSCIVLEKVDLNATDHKNICQVDLLQNISLKMWRFSKMIHQPCIRKLLSFIEDHFCCPKISWGIQLWAISSYINTWLCRVVKSAVVWNWNWLGENNFWFWHHFDVPTFSSLYRKWYCTHFKEAPMLIIVRFCCLV